MVTTIEEYNKQLEYVITDIKQRLKGGNELTPPHLQCYNMDKPIHVYTANVEEYEPGLIDKGDHYEMMYPRFGDLQKTYKSMCWIIDDHTVFIIERPFQNRIIRLLKHLLPDHNIHTVKNDVMIDNHKIGPTCMAGLITDWNGVDNPINSSLIYCLRWDDLDGLNEIFKDDPNHQERLNSKAPLACLSDYLNISREDFMRLIEAQQ